jgi:hypothetical protein
LFLCSDWAVVSLIRDRPGSSQWNLSGPRHRSWNTIGGQWWIPIGGCGTTMIMVRGHSTTVAATPGNVPTTIAITGLTGMTITGSGRADRFHRKSAAA